MTTNITETAINLAAQWKGTDPMRSADDVRKAVVACGDVPAENIDNVVTALLPLLRRDGTLVE